MNDENTTISQNSSSNIEEEIDVLLQISEVANRMARDLEIYKAVMKSKDK